MSQTRIKSAGLRYGVAVIATALSVAVKLLLGPVIVPSAFLTAYAAVLVSALYGGLGPGLLATVLSAFIDTDLFLSLGDRFTFVRVALFLLLGGAISWGAASARSARQRLAYAEQRYRRLFESNLLSILFWRADGTITEANDRALELVGYSRDELLSGGMTWRSITPPEYWDLDAGALAEVAATGQCSPFEKEYLRKDGGRVPILIGGAAFGVSNDEGVAFILDITERKRAEQALAAANARLEARVAERTAELQRSEERYRRVSELTSDFAYSMSISPSGEAILDWSAGAFERILGVTAEEIGVSGGLSLIHPDDVPATLRHAKRLVQGGPDAAEYRIVTRTGDVRWLRDNARGEWDEARQRVVRIVGAVQDITESKRAETALRETEERFQNAFRKSANGMALVALNGKPFQVNRALCDMFGYTEEELLASSVDVLTHPDDLAADREYARRLLAGEIQSCQFEKRYVHKRGHIVWASLSASLVRDVDGRPLHYVSQVEDVTERRRLYEQLRESEERFGNGFKYAPIGMALVGIDGRVLQVNQALCAMLGYSEAELLAKPSWEVTHPDELNNTIEHMYQMVTGKSDTWHLARRYIHKDGHLVWGDSSTSMVRDDKGNPLYVISQVQDITARKLVEDALRESESRFQNAFRHASVGMALVDMDGRPLQINPALCNMLGYTEAELLPKPVAEVIHPDDLAVGRSDLQRLIAGECTTYQAERRYLHKSGAVVWVQMSVSLVRDADGRPLHTVSQLQDITKARDALAALRASEERFGLAVGAANDGIWDWDLRTNALYMSPQCQRILGRGDDEPPPARAEWLHALHPDDYEKTSTALAAIVSGQINHYERELRLRHRDRSYRWVLGRGVVVRDADGMPYRMAGSLTDITERKQVSDILAALSAQIDFSAVFPQVAEGLRALARCDRASVSLFDQANEWATIVALDRPRSFPSPGARVSLADSPALPDVIAGRPFLVPDLATELSSPIVQQMYQAGVRSALILPLAGADRVSGMLVITWRTPGACNDAPLPVLEQIAAAVALAVEKSRLFEQVRAGHEQLQALTRELMRVQEAERRRLASELHDEIGQTLTGIKLMLDTLDRLAPPQASIRLAQVQGLVNDLMMQVRNLSLDLRPAVLDDLGLLPALLWLFGRYSAQTKVEVSFEHRGLERRLAPEVETAAFRIVQEALTNVARHADVAHVHVGAFTEDETLIVQVNDEGRGFEPTGNGEARTTAGLSGMRERAFLVGGQLRVQSTPDVGTHIRAELPLGDRFGRSANERIDLRGG